MSIGSNIRHRRLELGMSQRELAHAVGYRSRSTIASIESDESELPASRLLDLARALDTSVESLLSDLSPKGSITSNLRALPGSRNAVIVLAGGRSSRNLQNAPNQFLTVLGRPVISWCLERYQAHPMIDDMVVVCIDGWENVVWSCAERLGVSKLRAIVRAGETGVRSVFNGLERLRQMGYFGEDIVVVQESTRPLVSEEMISRVLLACREKGSAVTCGSMADNVQFVRSPDGWQLLDRDSVVDLQSPDAYKVGYLTEAFLEADSSGASLDDNSCAMMIHALGHPLNFCETGESNLKIVRQDDLAVFATLVRRLGR